MTDAAPPLRPLAGPDAPSLARLHRQELPDSFLPRLGSAFLVEMYGILLAEPTVFGFAAGPGEPEAFVLCTTDRASVDRAIGARRLSLLIKALPRLLASPTLLLALADGLTYAGKEHAAPAELVIIVVDGQRKSQGIGARLMEATRAEFRARGVPRWSVTVSLDNPRACRFYERERMTAAGTFRVFGRAMREYVS